MGGDAREHSDEGSHAFGIMNKEVNVSGHPMAQIGSGESRAASQVTGNARLAGPDEVEHEVRNDPPVERLTHGSPESGSTAATPVAAAPAAMPTSAGSAPDTESGAAKERGFRPL